MAVKGHCTMGISAWPPFSFDRTGREKPPDQGIVTGVREGSVLQVGPAAQAALTSDRWLLYSSTLALHAMMPMPVSSGHIP